MGKKRVMVPVERLTYPQSNMNKRIQAPHLTGFLSRSFVRLVEAPLIGPSIISMLKKSNKIDEFLRNTVIPEEPMFKPEYTPQEKEPGVVILDEDGRPEDRVEAALNCLPHYDPAACWGNSSFPFRYWKIRAYAYAYRSGKVTPSMVAENIISVIEEISNETPELLLISFDAEEVRRQASASTHIFEAVITIWFWHR